MIHKFKGLDLPEDFFYKKVTQFSVTAAACFNVTNAISGKHAWASAVAPSHALHPRPLLITPEFYFAICSSYKFKKKVDEILLLLCSLGFELYYVELSAANEHTIKQVKPNSKLIDEQLGRVGTLAEEDYAQLPALGLTRDRLCVTTSEQAEAIAQHVKANTAAELIRTDINQEALITKILTADYSSYKRYDYRYAISALARAGADQALDSLFEKIENSNILIQYKSFAPELIAKVINDAADSAEIFLKMVKIFHERMPTYDEHLIDLINSLPIGAETKESALNLFNKPKTTNHSLSFENIDNQRSLIEKVRVYLSNLEKLPTGSSEHRAFAEKHKKVIISALQKSPREQYVNLNTLFQHTSSYPALQVELLTTALKSARWKRNLQTLIDNHSYHDKNKHFKGNKELAVELFIMRLTDSFDLDIFSDTLYFFRDTPKLQDRVWDSLIDKLPRSYSFYVDLINPFQYRPKRLQAVAQSLKSHVREEYRMNVESDARNALRQDDGKSPEPYFEIKYWRTDVASSVYLKRASWQKYLKTTTRLVVDAKQCDEVKQLLALINAKAMPHLALVEIVDGDIEQIKILLQALNTHYSDKLYSVSVAENLLAEVMQHGARYDFALEAGQSSKPPGDFKTQSAELTGIGNPGRQLQSTIYVAAAKKTSKSLKPNSTNNSEFELYTAGEVLNLCARQAQRCRTGVLKPLTTDLNCEEYTPSAYKAITPKFLDPAEKEQLRHDKIQDGRRHYSFVQALIPGRNRLLSVNADDVFHGIVGNLPQHADAKLYRGDDDFYYLDVKMPCQVNYIIDVTLPQTTDTTLKQLKKSQKFSEILTRYQSPSAKVKSRPKYKNNIQRWLIELFEYGPQQDVPCRLRVQAMAYELHRCGFDYYEDFRIVIIDNNHQILELKNSNNTFSPINLGGTSARLKYAPASQKYVSTTVDTKVPPPQMLISSQNKPTNPTTRAAKKKAQTTTTQAASSTVARLNTVNEYFADKIKMSEVNTQQLLSMINQQSKIAVQCAYSDEFVHMALAFAHEQKEHALLFDQMSIADKHIANIHLSKNNVEYHAEIVPAESMFETFIAAAHQNPDQKYRLVIDWSKFTSTEKVSLNTILDEPPSAFGLKLPRNIAIISVTQQPIKDMSFHSRHTAVVHLTERPELKPQIVLPDEELQEIRIDAKGHEHWRETILGEFVYEHGELVFQPGPLLLAIENKNGGKIIIEHLPTNQQDECRQFLTQAIAQGVVNYHGHHVQLPANAFTVDIDSQSFNLKRVLPDTCRIHAQIDIDSAPEQALLINQQWFDTLLRQEHFIDEKYCRLPGHVERHKNSTLTLWVTTSLTDAQWYTLFTEASSHNTALEILCAPGVDIPDGLPLYTYDAPAEKSPEARSVPKIAYSQQPFAEFKIEQDALVIYVEDESVETLLGCTQFKFDTDNNAISFQKSKITPFLQALIDGKSVVLKGQFSAPLLEALHPILRGGKNIILPNGVEIKAIGDNLTIIAENTTSTELGLGFLKARCQHTDPQEKQPSHVLYDETSADYAIREDELESTQSHEDFIQARWDALSSAFDSNPFIALSGATGVGKSSFMREIARRKQANVYFGLSDISAWTNDHNPGTKILFIDEANLLDKHLTFIEALKQGAKQIHVNGQLFRITPEHKIVLAKNKNAYGGGRQEQRVFESGNYAELIFDDFPDHILYNKMLLPLAKDYKPTEIADFKKFCAAQIEQYRINRAQAQNDRDKPCVRDLQEAALKYLCSLKGMPEPKATNKTYSTLPSQLKVVNHLNLFIHRHSLQHDKKFPGNGLGLNGFYLEGAPGSGKSYAIARALSGLGYCAKDPDGPNIPTWYDKIDASLPLSEIRKRIITAFEQGQAIWIDEVNSISDDGIERVLNDVLTGTHPDGKEFKPGFMAFFTGNSAALSGRQLLSPALQHRCQCIDMPKLSTDDFALFITEQCIPQNKHFDASTIEYMAEWLHKENQENHNINLRILTQPEQREYILERLERIEIIRLQHQIFPLKNRTELKQFVESLSKDNNKLDEEVFKTLLEKYVQIMQPKSGSFLDQMKQRLTPFYSRKTKLAAARNAIDKEKAEIPTKGAASEGLLRGILRLRR